MSFIKELDDLHEGQQLEFKRGENTIPKDIWETYSAFANTEGGEIVLGVEERNVGGRTEFHVVGVSDPERLRREFWSQVRDGRNVSEDVLFPDAVSIAEVEGRRVVIIRVPKAGRYSKPVTAYSRQAKSMIAYIRRGESDFQARPAEIAMMEHDKSAISDAEPLEDLGIEALNPHTVAAYRQRFAQVRTTSPWVSEGDEDFLFHINALGPGTDQRMHPTRGGLLAFGQEHWIHTVFVNYHVDYQSRIDPSVRWSDRLQSGSGDWSGNLIDFYFEVVARLDRTLPQPFGLADNGMSHTAKTAVNDAIHEAVANAIEHAYYGAESRVRVVLEPDQLSITNSGTFLVDRNVAIAGGVTQARNPTLVKIFTLVGIVDRAGSGLQTIYRTWGERFGRRPSIDEFYEPDEVRITLPFNPAQLEAAQRRRVAANEIVALCRERGRIRAEDVVESFGMRRQSAQVALRRLAANGRLSVEKEGRISVYSAE